MSKSKDIIELTILGIILISLLILLSFIGIKTKNDNSNNLKEDINELKEENYNNKEKDSDKKDDNKKEENKNDNNKQEEIKKDTNNEENNSIKNENKDLIEKEVNSSEENVISHFKTMSLSLDDYGNENNTSFRDKAKSIFIDTVDFLFYDKEIKGHTFKNMTNAAKLKVLQLAATIDNKIDKYFPNYKENIKEKCRDLKAKIAITYLETVNKYCSNGNESTCNEARNNFNAMKNSFGYTWDILKSALTSGKDNLTLILSEWYKSIKE